MASCTTVDLTKKIKKGKNRKVKQGGTVKKDYSKEGGVAFWIITRTRNQRKSLKGKTVR